MIPALTERAFRLMAAVPVPGSIVEFGVYQGSGLRTMGQRARATLGEVPPLYGFDTFCGMPSTNQPLQAFVSDYWAPGTFADTSVDGVRDLLAADGLDATLVAARFDELRPLSEYGIDTVRLAHIDADLYESYRDALRLLTPHIRVGSVLLFDESVPPTDPLTQSVRDHGQKAVREWEETSGFNLHLIRFEWTVALCVLVDDEYLRRHWRVIDDLRKDTIQESLKNIVRRVARRPREVRPGYAR